MPILLISSSKIEIVRPFPYTLGSGVLEDIAPGVKLAFLVLYLTIAIDGVETFCPTALRAGVNDDPFY